MELVNGWEFEDTPTLKAVRDCGVAYRNAAGAITAEFACFVSLGAVEAGTSASDMYFVQSNATNAATASFTHLHTGDTFGVNELVQIYSDTNGDGAPDFNYRAYAKVFLRRAGYTYDEATNDEIGYPVLTYKKYNFPLTHAPDAGLRCRMRPWRPIPACRSPGMPPPRAAASGPTARTTPTSSR